MPCINSRKNYRKQSFYHVYNRGTNKQPIFFDVYDYLFFRRTAQSILKEYPHQLCLSVFACLPNHYHFLLFQTKQDIIAKFIKRLQIRYTYYINKRYERVGTLYQGVYRATYVSPAKYLITRQYILDNPIHAGLSHWKHVGEKL